MWCYLIMSLALLWVTAVQKIIFFPLILTLDDNLIPVVSRGGPCLVMTTHKNKILLPWNIWCGKMRHSWFLRQYYDRFCNNNETLSIKSNWLWLLCTGCFKVRNTVLFNLLRSFSKLLFFSSCGQSFINRSVSICDDIYFFVICTWL